MTKLDSELGFGNGYVYAHDTKEKVSSMICLPESIKDHKYYFPTDSGSEKNVKAVMNRIEEFKKRGRHEENR